MNRAFVLSIAVVLSGCASPIRVPLTSVEISVDERVADTREFANPGERLACQMDYKCNRPLTITQYRQQRDRLRQQIAEVYGQSSAPRDLPPIRSERDRPCDEGCVAPRGRSLVIRDPGQVELPDPPLR